MCLNFINNEGLLLGTCYEWLSFDIGYWVSNELEDVDYINFIKCSRMINLKSLGSILKFCQIITSSTKREN